MQDVLLVLETSCVQSSVAAWSGESLLCQAAWRAERNHSSAIFKAVRQVLDALEGRRLKEIVVGSGPGAYGGIRVALAVADGLSLVHGSRVAAFSSWNGLGLHHGEACVMSDARRGGWTWGRLENGVLTDVPAVLPAEQARACVAEFTFYLAIPVMAGASLLKLVKFFGKGNSFTLDQTVVLIVGCAVAFIVSIIAIRFLMDYVKRHTFTAFGVYRIALGIVVLVIWGVQTFVLKVPAAV